MAASIDNKPQQLLLKGVKIYTKNLAGINGTTGKAQYQPSFCVALSPKDAKILANEGWDVRLSKPNEETGEQVAFLPIKVGFKIENGIWDEHDSRNPRVERYFSDGTRDILTPNSIAELDRNRIEFCSVSVSPWWSEKKNLWSAYLRIGKFKIISDDPFANDPEWQVGDGDNEPLPFN
jgi:hypothetical protein